MARPQFSRHQFLFPSLRVYQRSSVVRLAEIRNSKPFQSHRLMSRSIVLDALSMHCSSVKLGFFLFSNSINLCAFLRSPSTWVNSTPYNLSRLIFEGKGRAELVFGFQWGQPSPKREG